LYGKGYHIFETKSGRTIKNTLAIFYVTR